MGIIVGTEIIGRQALQLRDPDPSIWMTKCGDTYQEVYAA